MDGRPTWTDCDEARDYVVPNVLSPRDLVSRPDIMDETVPHTYIHVHLFIDSGQDSLSISEVHVCVPTAEAQTRLHEFTGSSDSRCLCMITI